MERGRRGEEPRRRARAAGSRSGRHSHHDGQQDEHLPLLLRASGEWQSIIMANLMRYARAGLVPSSAVVGGALVGFGAFLPWLSLYAGLVPLRGVIGLYGRLFAAGGVVCLIAGVWSWFRPARRVERAIMVIGGGLAGFA